jgi:hypothetical protein
MSTTRSTIVGIAALSALLLGACGSDKKATTSTPAAVTTAAGASGTAAPGAAVTGSLDAADQTGDGTSITVKSVNITGSAGFIAIHADAGGGPGPVVGHVAIPEGDSSDVVVTLDAKSPTGAYWPMLHVDAGTPGTYEFPGPDGPVKSGADIVMKKITLTVS